MTQTASWPSPAQDYLEAAISIDREVLNGNTYILRAIGNDLAQLGIRNGDRLVVDRSIPVVLGQLIVIEADGKRWAGIYRKIRGQPVLWLGAATLPLFGEVRTWGVVTYCIHRFTPELS
ncbi:MAG: hypothetical protein FWG47_02595 [Propionibacteriaceae bacterium]|nr:hypothetical protein [Propionibacteriaceae bacterium]